MNRSRQGSSLLETTIAAVLVASLLSTTLESVSAIGRQRREAMRHTIAQQIVANQMEFVTMRARSTPLAAGQSKLKLAEADAATFSAAQLTLNVDAKADNAQMLRVQVNLNWRTDAGNSAQEQLMAWVVSNTKREASP